MIYAYNDIEPVIDPTCFTAPGAQIIGDVHIGRDSSVWFNSVVRGDVHHIRIGECTNVQDGCVLHVRKDKFPLIVGDHVTFGHGVLAQGSRIGSHVLMGMGAVILDDCLIGEYSIIAAGALLLEGTVVPPGTLMVGVPAKPRRAVSSAERDAIDRHATNYVAYKNSFLSGGFREVVGR